MRRTVYHGYDNNGLFHIAILEQKRGEATESPSNSPSISPSRSPLDHQVALTRAECQKISKHMAFGKNGEDRVIETVDGKTVK